MIIQIGTEADESRILWKHNEKDEWIRADIDELIEAYESIVRCKDCEYYDKGENEVDSWEMCKRNLHSTSQYDFCSWAKMKGGTE